MGVIMFNDISSEDYGILVEHPPGYQSPEKDYETIHIPGKNGDLVIDNNSYKNVTRSYEVAFGNVLKDFTSMANPLAEWLYSASGYARLEDTYEPEYYRMAMFQGELSVENILFHAGRGTIDFDCKPQRFLKLGEENVYVSKGGFLRNPTKFESKPLIVVYGSGSGVLTVGSYTVTFSNISNFVILDCEIMDAYKGSTNCNPDVTLANGFPKLVSGENVFNWSGSISNVEVVPRWWTI